MSHRIKRFAAVAVFAHFYLFAAMDSISGLFGHQMDTKVDTKTITATTKLSLSDELVFWCPGGSLSAGKSSHESRFPLSLTWLHVVAEPRLSGPSWGRFKAGELLNLA
jgi:hypothetical protein